MNDPRDSHLSDREIVDLYWARDERAISATQEKYGRYCHYIAYRITECDADAEEVVNDTLLKTWNTIPPHRPELLKPYLGMLCRQLALDVYDAKHAAKRDGGQALVLEELAECIPDGNGADLGEAVALGDAMDRFVRSLPRRTRRIFLRRYWYSDPVADIAADFELTVNRVNVLLFHTREKLKKFLTQEGFTP